jgi:hypothetical protein
MTNKQDMKDAQNGAKGEYHSNGFTPAKPQPTTNYKNYCFKCGKPMSSHSGLFKSCPK